MTVAELIDLLQSLDEGLIVLWDNETNADEFRYTVVDGCHTGSAYEEGADHEGEDVDEKPVIILSGDSL
jgi:hypothetical protein